MASSSQSTSTFRPERTLIGFAIVVAMLFALMALTGTWTPRLGLDLRGGTTITLTARTSDGSTVPRENLETARNIIQNRVDSLGVGESSVTIQGNDKIEVCRSECEQRRTRRAGRYHRQAGIPSGHRGTAGPADRHLHCRTDERGDTLGRGERGGNIVADCR